MYEQYKDVKPAILIKNALDHIVAPGSVFEVRIPKTRSGTISGYFDDTAIAAGLIAKENNKHQAIYVTANPVSHSVLARNSNKLEYGSHTTTNDAEIESRRWFLIDLDPVRPAGISSTDQELAAALERATAIKEWLTSLGWPEPLEASSGNGAHLMYRVDEPNDEETRSLFEYATKMLAGIFSDDVINIDVTVWNASRIWKIYGTVAAKGSNTEERPHRVGMLTRIPAIMTPVPRGLIENVARPLQESKTDEFRDMTGEYIADMDKWLFDRGITVTSGPRPLYGTEGKKWTLAHCVFNPQHTTAMVGLVNNRPVFRCLHNSCSAFRWKDFREKVDPNFKDPDTIKTRLLEWGHSDKDTFDEEMLESACRTGNKLDGILKIVKKEIARARFLLLEDALKQKRRQFIKETLGENNDRGNVVGLINRVKSMQAEGAMPMYWTCDYDHRIRAGDIGDINANRLSASDEIKMLVRFHSLGDTWVKQGHCAQVIQHLADEYRVNPLRNYLKSLRWDGVKRLDTWLHDIMRTVNNIYNQSIGRKWMISAVARGMEPGCQADHMLIFEGKQGIGKSQALRILGGQFYVEFSRAITGSQSNHKDMVAAMTGKMILEMSELATIRRSDIESLKAILTTTVDEVRLSYERDSKAYPRTAVFSGTTNEEGQAYIADQSGARRFWPTAVGVCGPVQLERLKEVRDQLWAEAVEAYENGEDWYKVPDAIVSEEQEQRQLTTESTDPWYSAVRESLTNSDFYANGVWRTQKQYVQGQEIPGEVTIRLGTVSNLLQMVLSIDIDKQDAGAVGRIRSILKALQFKRVRPSGGWVDSTYAYELTRQQMPHLWPAIQAASKSARTGEFQPQDLDK